MMGDSLEKQLQDAVNTAIPEPMLSALMPNLQFDPPGWNWPASVENKNWDDKLDNIICHALEKIKLLHSKVQSLPAQKKVNHQG